jgi:hypothetical protein
MPTSPAQSHPAYADTLVTRSIFLRNSESPDLQRAQSVRGERVQWCGIPLFIHERVDNFHDPWVCTHEPSGVAISDGDTREDALARAIKRIRERWEFFHERTATLPVLNPPAGNPVNPANPPHPV